MGKTVDSKQAVEDILNFLLYFRQLSKNQRAEHFELNPYDGLAMIPNPFGQGGLICGRAALQRFSEIAKWYLSENKVLANHIDVVDFEYALQRTFGNAFLKGQQTPTARSVNVWIKDTIATIESDYSTTTHHVPCSLPVMDEPSGFRIARVWFRPSWEFLRSNKKKTVDGYEVESILRNFGWVATVRIPKCRSSTSREHAMRVVIGSLNLLRLMLPDWYAAECTSVYSATSPAIAGHLVRSRTAGLHESLSKRFPPPPLRKDWLRSLRKDEARFYCPAECALRMALDLSSEYPLAHRVIDSLAWFGDAVTETDPATKIVKFVIAMERMLLAGESKKRKHLSGRVFVLAARYLEVDPEKLSARIEGLYDLRSDIVHGKIARRHVDLSMTPKAAYSAARQALLAGLVFYDWLGITHETFVHRRLRNELENLDKERKQKLAAR